MSIDTQNGSYKLSWDEMENERMTDLISRRTLHGENATVARIALANGAVVARHFHVNEQYSMILSGAMRFVFDDRELIVSAGEILFIPANVPHSAVALEESVNLEVFAPRRDDWIHKDETYLRPDDPRHETAPASKTAQATPILITREKKKP